MGFLDNIFGSTSGTGQEQKRLPWIQLTDSEQLEGLVNESDGKPKLIYKHSTTCGISSMVLNMFTRSYGFADEQADLYFLDIHRYRPLSDEISEKFRIRHESPQLIIVSDGEVKTHTSHGAIADLDLSSYIP